MGFYVNPRNKTKEQFVTNLKEIDIMKFRDFDFDNAQLYPLCLVDNGIFKALGIAYNKEEVIAFSEPDDDRPKRFFIITTDHLNDPETGADPGFDKYRD